MQETKRRGKKGVILLALIVALLVVALVPAAAMASTPPAPSQLTPVVTMNGVTAQGNYSWFAGSPNAGYQAAMNGVTQIGWTGIVVPALSGGGTLDVGTIVYKVDGTPAGGIAVPVGAYPTIINYNYTSSWSTEGIHTVESWLKETTATAKVLVEKPIVTSVYGMDLTAPEWQHIMLNGADIGTNSCFWNIPVKFSAVVSDQYGSGVAPTPTASWDTTSSATNGHPAYQLAWDQYTWEVTGTVAVVAPSGDDAISFSATDYVGHVGTAYWPIKFDTLAPHTSYTIDPAGADTQAGWTNKDVTLTFKSADDRSGVAYTEYKVLTSTTTAVPAAPKLTDSGTKGTSVKITDTAPIGPVYVYYRSVDKACPTGNAEAWNLVMVFIDKVAPALSDDVPTWWINAGEGRVVNGNDTISFGGTCYATITASDHNSGIAPPGITWMIEGHNPPFGGTSMGPTVQIPILPLALGDGIRNLKYNVADKAGNKAEATTEIKIDTRPPVTDGASGWINGLVPYVLTATDQVPGSGVAATVYRVDQKTPWSVNSTVATATPSLATSITWTSPQQDAIHTIDFASVDAALPCSFDATKLPVGMASWHFGNWELDILNLLATGSVYKSRSVKLDVTAPAVTAMDPKNGEWQKGPATVNFSGTDVGSGYAYTEWSTDGGATWTKGEVAQVGGNGEITVTYHGVDKVGIKSADATIMVKVASTGPSVVGGNASAKKGAKATFSFNVTSVTPQVRVIIQIRTKSGRTVSTHNYANVTANSDQTRSFKVNYPKGKYNIRISAVDQADNNQTKRGTGTLTVK